MQSIVVNFVLVVTIALVVHGTVDFTLDQIKLVFYYGPTYEDSEAYQLSEAAKILSHPKFIYDETHLYLHGYRENQTSESIHLMVDSYHKRNDTNLITVDWGDAASGFYPQAALKNIEVLGPYLADSILDLFEAGLNRKSFTVVSHSLGSQLAGLAARSVINKTNGEVKIYRLVLLDPAFPLFFNILFLRTVDRNDAEFVQAIHTDIGTYGQPLPLGHVDFWPNGGIQGQPGCPSGFLVPFSDEDLCSHQRSWRFWAESVANVDGPEFWAFPAPNYVNFLVEGIQKWKDKAIPMGINCPVSARGSYFLKTNDAPPFAMGFEGY